MYKKVDSKLLQIGNNVREYRKQKHYNQEKLAELLDVSVATVSRIENGSSAMDILILMNISKILEQPIDNIISFATFILIILFLNLHVFYSILKLNFSIKNDKYIKKYSRVLLPSFLYIIITNIFFTIISFFKGGIFKGWLSKK